MTQNFPVASNKNTRSITNPSFQLGPQSSLFSDYRPKPLNSLKNVLKLNKISLLHKRKTQVKGTLLLFNGDKIFHTPSTPPLPSPLQMLAPNLKEEEEISKQ